MIFEFTRYVLRIRPYAVGIDSFPRFGSSTRRISFDHRLFYDYLVDGREDEEERRSYERLLCARVTCARVRR